MSENLLHNTNKPAVLVFYLSEFFEMYGMSVSNFSQTVYDSPFYIYDRSLKGKGPKFVDEIAISDEDCKAGFAILSTIWTEYVAPSDSPGFSRIFKITTDADSDDFYVESTYGFVPGYDMNAAIETITKQNFDVIRWDEFWDEDFENSINQFDSGLTDEHDPESMEERKEEGRKIKLLIKTETNDHDAISFGGLPVKDRTTSFEWPKCVCGAELQYQGKIKTDIGYEMIFMENCDHWGSTKVIIVDAEDIESVHPEDSQIAIRETAYVAKIEEVTGDSYDDARDDYPSHRRDVLGHISDRPEWIQGDETPKCDCCGQTMRFVAQLEEGPDYETAMNFGGGCGYLFDCTVGKTAKFITQC